MRFANVAALPVELSLESAVQGSGHQGFAPIKLRCINNEPAIGRKTGAFIRRCFGEDSDGTAGQLQQIHSECAVHAGYVGQPAAIRADRWRDVVTTGESHTLRLTARGNHFVDLGPTTPITDKENVLAIRRICRLGVNAARLA